MLDLFRISTRSHKVLTHFIMPAVYSNDDELHRCSNCMGSFSGCVKTLQISHFLQHLNSCSINILRSLFTHSRFFDPRMARGRCAWMLLLQQNGQGLLPNVQHCRSYSSVLGPLRYLWNDLSQNSTSNFALKSISRARN